MRWSEQQNFNTCPFKYSLQQQGLKKITEGGESNDLRWGQAIHAGLEAHYQGKGLNAAREAFLAIYPEDLKVGEKVKTKHSGLLLLERYATYYAEQDKNWKVLDTEVKGTVSITGEEGEEDHDLHIDLIAENLQGGGIYFWDHKTTYKNPSPSYWTRYQISSQITRYTKYVIEKYGQCSGAYINNMTVGYTPPKEECKKNTFFESLSSPASYYEFNKKEFSKYHKQDMTIVWGCNAKFERQLFNRTQEQIDFWLKSDEEWMKLIDFCKKEGVYPKALGTLCGWCEYYELCISSDSPEIRKSMYGTEMGEIKIQ